MTLLADPVAVRLEKIISSAESLTLVVVTKRREAICPRCEISTVRVHSRYARRVADLPWQGVAVKLKLGVRRFRCINDLCQQNIFCERLPSVVARYARKTARLTDALTLIGFALGGRPGALLSAELAMRAGRDSLLRLVRRAPQIEHPTPKVLGVDDWAKRKGDTYGTILVDLERRRPVDLLPDREAATFAAWLHAHPGVSIISRDRGGSYADGARRGAPDAAQVADRWHILKNLGETVERIISREHAAVSLAARLVQAAEQECTNAAVAAALDVSVVRADEACAVVKAHATGDVYADERREAHRARQMTLYEQIVGLDEQGVSRRAIARRLRIARNTVRRYLRADGFPEELPRGRRPGGTLDRHKPYLSERWRAGCTVATRLWGEIKERGFRGSVDVVQRFISTLRARLPGELRDYVQQHTSGRVPLARLPTRAMHSPREVVWLLLREPRKLKDDERVLLDHLFAASTDLTAAYAFAQSFRKLVRERDGVGFRAWLTRARSCHVREIKSFAHGLLRDLPAVEAAFSSEWSQGQVEGHVNRLKNIKRAMYGRANFDLLKARVLHSVT